jgi:UDP-2,3-diacylglucosamine pyrophosphatase LpxH
MRIQIVSDLHFETHKEKVYLQEYIEPTGDILVMAGDIGSMYRTRQLIDILEQACSMFPIVIFVPGNHEYYMLPKSKPRRFSTLETVMFQFKMNHENFYFLNRAKLQIGDYLFIGATLWTNPHEFTSRIVRIHNITKERFTMRHNLDKKFIYKSLFEAKNNHLKPIVITHYPPSAKAKNPNRKDDKFSSLYYNDLDVSNVFAWISGHTHYNYHTIENGCTLISNQLGKKKDNIQDFKKNCIIEI